MYLAEYKVPSILIVVQFIEQNELSLLLKVIDILRKCNKMNGGEKSSWNQCLLNEYYVWVA